jgi:hypothetical protein
MMDEFIHGPYLLLLAMLSTMIEIWMKYHLVSDSDCNTIQGMTNNVGLTFSVGGIQLQFASSIEQDN